ARAEMDRARVEIERAAREQHRKMRSESLAPQARAEAEVHAARAAELDAEMRRAVEADQSRTLLEGGNVRRKVDEQVIRELQQRVRELEQQLQERQAPEAD